MLSGSPNPQFMSLGRGDLRVTCSLGLGGGRDVYEDVSGPFPWRCQNEERFRVAIRVVAPPVWTEVPDQDVMQIQPPHIFELSVLLPTPLHLRGWVAVTPILWGPRECSIGQLN